MTDARYYSTDNPSHLDQIEATVDGFACPGCGGGLLIDRTPESISVVHDCAPHCTRGEH